MATIVARTANGLKVIARDWMPRNMALIIPAEGLTPDAWPCMVLHMADTPSNSMAASAAFFDPPPPPHLGGGRPPSLASTV